MVASIHRFERIDCSVYTLDLVSFKKIHKVLETVFNHISSLKAPEKHFNEFNLVCIRATGRDNGSLRESTA